MKFRDKTAYVWDLRNVSPKRETVEQLWVNKYAATDSPVGEEAEQGRKCDRCQQVFIQPIVVLVGWDQLDETQSFQG